MVHALHTHRNAGLINIRTTLSKNSSQQAFSTTAVVVMMVYEDTVLCHIYTSRSIKNDKCNKKGTKKATIN